MTTITVPEKLTGAPYLRENQTIYRSGTDTKVMEVYPLDRKITAIPAEISVVFSEPVTDITITNLIDTTPIDLSYVSYETAERDKYDYYKDKKFFPTTVKKDTYVLSWQYYFTKEPWVIFKLAYTDLDGNNLTYEFTIYNETPIKQGDYILTAQQQP